MMGRVSYTGAVASYTVVEGSCVDIVDRSKVAEGCFQGPPLTAQRFGETQLYSGSIETEIHAYNV